MSDDTPHRGTSYELVHEEPPDPGDTGGGTTAASSPLLKNMERAATEFLGEWVRIAAYNTRNTADTTASQLRSGGRLKSRPAGTWEFRSGPTEDGRFGVWAKVTL